MITLRRELSCDHGIIPALLEQLVNLGDHVLDDLCGELDADAPAVGVGVDGVPQRRILGQADRNSSATSPQQHMMSSGSQQHAAGIHRLPVHCFVDCQTTFAREPLGKVFREYRRHVLHDHDRNGTTWCETR